jgi:hypothetical protein
MRYNMEKKKIIERIQDEIDIEEGFIDGADTEDFKFYSLKQRHAFVGGMRRILEIIKEENLC